MPESGTHIAAGRARAARPSGALELRALGRRAPEPSPSRARREFSRRGVGAAPGWRARAVSCRPALVSRAGGPYDRAGCYDHAEALWAEATMPPWDEAVASLTRADAQDA